MVKICEHKFESPDTDFPEYSVREVDLFPAAGEDGQSLSLRRNIEADLYQIFDYTAEDVYSDRSVMYWDEDLERVVNYAEILELDAPVSSSMEYGCGPFCPETDPLDSEL